MVVVGLGGTKIPFLVRSLLSGKTLIFLTKRTKTTLPFKSVDERGLDSSAMFKRRRVFGSDPSYEDADVTNISLVLRGKYW